MVNFMVNFKFLPKQLTLLKQDLCPPGWLMKYHSHSDVELGNLILYNLVNDDFLTLCHD